MWDTMENTPGAALCFLLWHNLFLEKVFGDLTVIHWSDCQVSQKNSSQKMESRIVTLFFFLILFLNFT